MSWTLSSRLILKMHCLKTRFCFSLQLKGNIGRGIHQKLLLSITGPSSF